MSSIHSYADLKQIVMPAISMQSKTNLQHLLNYLEFASVDIFLKVIPTELKLIYYYK